MELLINNKIIDADIVEILERIRSQTNYKYFKTIRRRPDNISTNCPFHKDGQEQHPSFNIVSVTDDKELPFGFYRCFTCGEQGMLYRLVSHCLSISEEDAKEWLTDNFSNTFVERDLHLEPIELNKKEYENFLDETLLDDYRMYHPYLEDRHIPFEVAKYFNVGYDQTSREITFPVWDEHNRLKMITRRSIDNKHFHLQSGIDKPIYLLNYIKLLNISEVTVVESQIDALTLWSWNIPAVALLGTGSAKQYEILKRSGIRTYHLALDGDEAGWKGTSKFIKNMPNDVFIDIIRLPDNKDINDITYDEFKNLFIIDKYNWKY